MFFLLIIISSFISYSIKNSNLGAYKYVNLLIIFIFCNHQLNDIFMTIIFLFFLNIFKTANYKVNKKNN
ncbi:hypothetical protein C7N43_29930 [Sphingobacteriales bacterium UPWRP_1]|nr:hypothetical protein B6N25_13120 [Sphingobacteriales bacterium TSM_CSS]PSJ73292.1 hypothetical protein C7N43_29930 [Sphingobacteriales bacterium UPWRP_1]